MRKLSAFWLLVLFVVFSAFNSPAAEAQNPFAQSTGYTDSSEFLPVNEAFRMDYTQDGNTLEVSWVIEDGYYMYQHRFGFQPEALISEYYPLPEGIEHNDEFFGDSIVYRDFVSLKVDLTDVRAGDVLTVRFQGCADAGLCYAPTTREIYLQAAQGGDAVTDGGWELQDFSEESGATSGFFEIMEGDNLAWTAALFLLLGLGLAFTPCVFPMYPIISGIILGQKRPLSIRRGFMLSFVYVQGMAITYTLLGILVALAGMQYQAYLQHPALLGVLALIFAFLALVMFGVINLDMPSSWKNKLNEISQKQKGGAYPGVFMMGVLSGLIASPCTTAPLSGALLFIAQTGDVAYGGTVLYALSIGMGIPLLVIGTSGGKILPKGGQWMDTIKVLFGVLLLAVALFMAERLLPLKVSAVLWVLFFIGSAILLYWKLHKQFKLRGRVITAVLFIALVSYGVQWQKPYLDGSFEANKLEFTYVSNLTELQAKLQQAQSTNQFVMLDLYADWCVACLELERYTFSDPAVQEQLEDVLVLQADVTAVNATNTELLSEYQVLGLPTILFFSPEGDELTRSRVTGFMSAERFAEHLERIKDNN